ncbi:MAG: preprotein translocase subunit SecG [Candidatus Eiseniibacteriota bacterium]
MYGFLLFIHLLICLSLVAVVLVQSGKGGGLAGGAFGGSAQTVFGGRGATDFFSRATMVLGAAFFVTSLALALISSGASGPRRSIVQEQARRSASSTPAQAPSSGPTQSGAPTLPIAPGTPAKPATPGH